MGNICKRIPTVYMKFNKVLCIRNYIIDLNVFRVESNITEKIIVLYVLDFLYCI